MPLIAAENGWTDAETASNGALLMGLFYAGFGIANIFLTPFGTRAGPRRSLIVIILLASLYPAWQASKQEPAEALSQLPPDAAGNKVDWINALRGGYVEPRTNIQPETKVNLRETELIMKNTGSANYVRFPHKAHTEWLDCSNCHDHLFAREVGKTPMTMLAILSGEYCGRCHGAVAFPLTECNRCHSVVGEGQAPASASGAVVGFL